MRKATLLVETDRTDKLTAIGTFTLNKDECICPSIPAILLYGRSMVTVVPGEGYVARIEEDEQNAN